MKRKWYSLLEESLLNNTTNVITEQDNTISENIDDNWNTDFLKFVDYFSNIFMNNRLINLIEEQTTPNHVYTYILVNDRTSFSYRHDTYKVKVDYNRVNNIPNDDDYDGHYEGGESVQLSYNINKGTFKGYKISEDGYIYVKYGVIYGIRNVTYTSKIKLIINEDIDEFKQVEIDYDNLDELIPEKNRLIQYTLKNYINRLVQIAKEGTYDYAFTKYEQIYPLLENIKNNGIYVKKLNLFIDFYKNTFVEQSKCYNKETLVIENYKISLPQLIKYKVISPKEFI